MDNRERFTRNPFEPLLAALDGRQAEMWTALPGVIESVDLTKMTASVQPAMKASISRPDGSSSLAALPLLPDVPICFSRGGGYTATFPVKKGDECLIVFASRSIDAWFALGDAQQPLDQRMHDINDGFAIVGPFSQQTAGTLTNVSPTAAELRSNDGSVKVSIDVTTGTATITAPTQIVVNTPTAHFTGNITSDGDVTAGTVSLRHHVHPIPSGTSGQPVQ